MHPTMHDTSLGAYAALSAHGITPASTMREVQLVFPRTDEESRASDRLTRVDGRLAIDLLLYPIWTSEESTDGPR